MKGKGKMKNWIDAVQPWTFIASVSAAIMTISYVFYLYNKGLVAEINWLFGIIALVGVVSFQKSGKMMTIYQDFKYGLAVERIFKPNTILIFSLIALIFGIAVGIYLMLNTGWPILLIGCLGIIGVLFYHKLKYVALGDMLIFVIFGLSIPLGIAYVMTGELIWTILLVSIPLGLLEIAIYHADNTRDINEDKAAGIKTQATILGLEGAQVTYQTFLLAAYLFIAILVSVGLLHPLTFLTLLSFPIAVRNIKKMKQAGHNDQTSIQQLDFQTAKLLMFFALLFTIANFIAPFIK